MSPTPIVPPSLRLWSVQAGESTSQSAPTPAAGDLPSGFQEILSTLLMSASLPGSLGQESGMGSLVAPLMLTLIEKLIAQQVAAGEKPVAVENQVVQPETVSQQDAPEQPAAGPSGMPIRGRLTQRAHAGHMALDFGAPVGTPVKATMGGRVVYAGWNDEGYGKLVIVQNGHYRTFFAHLSKIPVKVGQQVEPGSVVGLSGNTGNSTGPHLHYEVRKQNQPINPARFTLAERTFK